MEESLKLFTFWQSGSSFRVRIALNLKGLAYEPIFVRGGRGSTDLRSPEYLALNPQGVIPTLVDRGRVFTQSSAIIEYLEETYPDPPLLPGSAADRAWVRSLAQIIVSDTHPLITARVIDHLSDPLKLDHNAQKTWVCFWIERGLRAFEESLKAGKHSGGYCYGTTPTIADVCLVPQVYTAMRYGCDFSYLPIVEDTYRYCLEQPAFQRAAPENQPDSPDRRVPK